MKIAINCNLIVMHLNRLDSYTRMSTSSIEWQQLNTIAMLFISIFMIVRLEITILQNIKIQNVYLFQIFKIAFRTSIV